MRGLTNREKRLLAFCVLTIFVMANVFAGRAVLKTLKGGGEKISALKNEIAEQDMWLEEQDYWERRRGWLDGHMPPPIDSVDWRRS